MLDAVTATQLAMEFDQLKLQSISHNVANMSTSGFKRQLIDNTGFDDQLPNELKLSHLDTQGTVTQTHKNTDLAIAGDGYFQVQNERGIFYTRRGDFHVNPKGELVTATEDTLLSASGVVQVDDADFTVDTQGGLFINHHKIAQLNSMQFNQSSQLRYMGNGLYETDESPETTNANTRIVQGFIEQSNVASVDEMLDMIKISRHFEANQRIMRTADNLLSAAINQLGEGNV